MVAGTVRQHIARLNNDGTLDSSFSAAASTDGTVSRIYNQNDGHMFLCGDFRNVNGQQRSGIERLNADGTTRSPTSLVKHQHFTQHVAALIITSAFSRAIPDRC